MFNKRPLPGRVLSWLMTGTCLLYLPGCNTTGKVPSPTATLTGLSAAAATPLLPLLSSAPAQTSTFTPGPILSSTRVIVFQPEGVPAQERPGSCWAASNVLNRVDAWRCFAGNNIYDPCFSLPGSDRAVICGTSPLGDRTGFKLDLTEALPLRRTETPARSAWAFELADGTQCIFMGGATAAFGGERVNFSCSDGWFLLGEAQEGLVWTARKIRISSDLSSIEETVQVFIKIVWL